jgi:hypothetical protein
MNIVELPAREEPEQWLIHVYFDDGDRLYTHIVEALELENGLLTLLINEDTQHMICYRNWDFYELEAHVVTD